MLPINGEIIFRLVVICLLLMMSGLISGSETAFFSLTPQNVTQLGKEEGRGSRAAVKLLSMQEYLLATILITNNFVNICIAILSGSTIDMLIYFESGVLEIVFKLVLVTFLLLFFGEILPKIFAAYNPMKFVRFISPPTLLLKTLCKPFSYVLIHLSSFVNESVAKKRANISMEELSNAIEITTNQTEEERQMLSGIVDFVNRDVADIMRPRIDIVAIDSREKFDKVREVVMESGYSRIPVYEETIDNVKGVIYVKDLIPYIGSDNNFEWANLLRAPYFVPEHKKINELLEEFQSSKMHMAIVVDEYGSVMGLVSLEDILEEIVGEISDESDMTDDTFYTKISPNAYIFDGKAHINELLKVIGFEDGYLNPVRGDAETIAGVMLELKRDFLKRGDIVTYELLTMSVEQLEGRRIDKVKVVIKETN